MRLVKILIVGDNKQYSLETYYLNNLQNLGADVSLFNSREFVDRYRQRFFNNVKLRLGVSTIYKKIGTELLKKVKSYNPTVIIVFKGMELNLSTLKAIKNKGIFLINYNPDHPFSFSGLGSGNKNVIANNSIYNLHLTYGLPILKEIKKKLGANCEILPFGYEFSLNQFDQIKKFKEINRVCFIGFPDKRRASKIKFLLANKIPVTVFGGNWSNFLKKNDNLIIINKPLYGLDYWRKLREYRVQLNIFRPHNLGTHNMRSFEIPAAGGIMLSTNPSDHDLYFKKDCDFFEYLNDIDLVEKCKMLLKMSVSDANSIRIRARKKSIMNNYSYFSKAKLLQEIIQKYI